MPQIPRYSTPEVQVQGLPTPTAQGLSPEAFGAGFGRALDGISRDVLKVAKEEKEQADRTAVLNARTSLDKIEVDLLYGNKDKPGALSNKGENAFSIDKPTLEAYDKSVSDISAGLKDPRQQETFRLFASERRNDVQKQLARHINTELQSYATEKNQAALESTMNNVAVHYNDPARVEQERKFGVAIIQSDRAAKGLPAEVVQARLAKLDSAIHSTVIDRLIIDDPVKAKKYFDANKDFILPGDAAKIEKTIKPLAAAQEGNQAAREIVDGNPGEKIDVLMTKARDRFKNDPVALKHAEGEIKSMIVERETARKQQVEEVANEVYGYLSKVQLAGRIPKRSDVPAQVWAKLAKVDPDAVNKITDEMRREQEHQADRAEAKRDRADAKATMEKLTTWGLLKGNPQTLMNTNLDALVVQGKITKEHYKDLLTDQKELRNNPDKGTVIQSNKSAVDTVLNSAGIKADKHPEKYMQFQAALSDRLKSYKAANGKEASQDEIVRLSRGLLSEVGEDRRFLWDTTSRAFEVNPEKVIVPKAERDAIGQALRTKRRPVTEAAIRQIYLESTIRKGGK